MFMKTSVESKFEKYNVLQYESGIAEICNWQILRNEKVIVTDSVKLQD